MSYQIKVIAHSASGKSILGVVSKKAGIFTSEVATGSIKLEVGTELPAVGTVIPLDGITKVTTRTELSEATADRASKEFTWLVLE